ncbi:MAG: OmpA family protein [Acidobacteriota bacterium]
MKRLGLSIGLALMIVGAVACKKKTPPIAPPGPVAGGIAGDPGPTGPAPILGDRNPQITSFTAEPARVERGQSVTLRWATTNATEVSLDQGLGVVAATGTRQVSPTGTTTYVLLARNGTNTDTRSATVEVVNTPIPIPQAPKTTSGNGGGRTIAIISGEMQDILFDYDMADMRDDARRALNADAALLKEAFALDPRVTFVVEGHADDRGSAEYNLGLADRRAVVVRDQLGQLGIPANRLRTISYGEEMPVCREQTDGCWQRNRRAHLTAAQ